MLKLSATLLTALILSIALAGLHFLANAFYLYWIFWWYDTMMHFLAGATLGFFSFWILFDSGHFFKTEQNTTVSILSVFFCVLVLGLAWELLEYTHGIMDSHEGYRLDTINDLILDSAGGIIAGLLSLKNRRIRTLFPNV